MKWLNFLDMLKGLDNPYTGTGEYEDVVSWLKMNGYNSESVDAGDDTYVLKDLYDSRAGKKLDVSAAVAQANRESEIDDRVKAALKEHNAIFKTTKQHDIKVGDDRIVNDEKGGFKHLGQFVHDVCKVARDGGEKSDTLGRWEKAVGSTYAGESVGADGGFLVPPNFAASITVKVMGEDSLLSRTDQQRISSGNSMSFPYDEDEPWNSTGIQAQWSGETGTLTKRKPVLTQKELKLKKVACLVPMTDELMSDAPAAGAYVASKAGDVLDFEVSNRIIRGVGNTQPLGILNSAGLITVAAEGGQTANTITGVNVIKMWAKLYGRYRSDAIWLVNQTAEVDLLRLGFQGRSDAGAGLTGWGQFLYQPATGLAGQQFATILGRPVITHEVTEELGQVGDIMLLGMSQYATLLKGDGIESASSMHLWFDQMTTALRFSMRMDGMPWSNSTIAQRDTDTATNVFGAFVALAAR